MESSNLAQQSTKESTTADHQEEKKQEHAPVVFLNLAEDTPCK